MNKHELLKKYFPEKESFRGVQEPAIDAIINNEKVLCLMPTGAGKSLIYQIAGMALGKTTLVISPLVALMEQQAKQLSKRGFDVFDFSGLGTVKQTQILAAMGKGKLPNFIFSSPERLSSDGLFEYILNIRKEDIGLVVLDEVHCVSQWGEGFRPAYRNIPLFLDRAFGPTSWPGILCLTATLNDNQRVDVERQFKISRTIREENMWRENLELKIFNLKDGKEDTKDSELEKIFEAHKGEKILVFVHRVRGSEDASKSKNTRSLYKKYKDLYPGVAYFDSQADDNYKTEVLEGFANGIYKIVFATSAFGMGVDISDIRVVVNYLISENVEQYYQEVGRAGRDRKPAFGYLLYTHQSRKGRKMLLNESLCNENELKEGWEYFKLKPGQKYRNINYSGIAGLTDEQRKVFALFMDFGLIEIAAKGMASLKPLVAVNTQGEQLLSEFMKNNKPGFTSIYVKKAGISLAEGIKKVYEGLANGWIKAPKALDKALFYTTKGELDEDILAKILTDQENKKQARIKEFEIFANGVEAGKCARELVHDALGI